jgi:hypothetical protein
LVEGSTNQSKENSLLFSRQSISNIYKWWEIRKINVYDYNSEHLGDRKAFMLSEAPHSTLGVSAWDG